MDSGFKNSRPSTTLALQLRKFLENKHIQMDDERINAEGSPKRPFTTAILR